MEEPNRIGLTKETNAFIEELLEELNPSSGEEGIRLIKFDLIRLAVALGVKNNKEANFDLGKTDNAFRSTELDPDKALYYAVQASNISEGDEPIYKCIERLANVGIREMYELYRENMGKLPINKLLE